MRRNNRHFSGKDSLRFSFTQPMARRVKSLRSAELLHESNKRHMRKLVALLDKRFLQNLSPHRFADFFSLDAVLKNMVFENAKDLLDIYRLRHAPEQKTAALARAVEGLEADLRDIIDLTALTGRHSKFLLLFEGRMPPRREAVKALAGLEKAHLIFVSFPREKLGPETRAYREIESFIGREIDKLTAYMKDRGW